MALNLYDPAYFHQFGNEARLAGPLSVLAATAKGPVHSSKDVSGIELRMLPPLILENHTTPVWPFPGYSQLYCVTVVVSDATNQLAGAIDLKGFPRIGDQEYLPINKTVFYWQAEKEGDKAPNQIHVLCSVIKSKKSLRDVGKALTEIKDDKEYKSVITTLGKIAKNAAKVNVVTDLVSQIGTIVGRHLGNVEDKPIGTILNSYTTLHGDFDTIGVQKLAYPTKDVHFHFELVVRNKGAEAQLKKAMEKGQFSINGKRKTNLAVADENVIVDMQPL